MHRTCPWRSIWAARQLTSPRIQPPPPL